MLKSYYPISTMVHVLIDVDDGPYELTLGCHPLPSY